MKTSLMRAVWVGVWVLAFGVCASLARAEVKLAAVFSDHAVFQRDRAVPVWGTAEAGEKVEVVFGAQTKEVLADAAGKWRVVLDALPANAVPVELIVRGTNTVTLHDILVGDVWLCSGQSNMERQVGERPGQKALPDAEAEIAAANFPQVRLFKVKKQKVASPGKDVEAVWEVCAPETLRRSEFSAVGYFFGKKIHQEIGVPVGLIDATWGGTRIEPWSKRDDEFGKRAAFALLASLALHDKKAPDDVLRKCLPIIERGAADDRNFVRKGVLWALRLVGRRSADLHAESIALARQLAASPSASARWVGRNALRDLTSAAVVQRLRRKRR